MYKGRIVAKVGGLFTTTKRVRVVLYHFPRAFFMQPLVVARNRFIPSVFPRAGKALVTPL
jgi:hypothetical protein